MRIRDYRFKTVLYDKCTRPFLSPPHHPAGNTSPRDGPVNSNTFCTYVPSRVSSPFHDNFSLHTEGFVVIERDRTTVPRKGSHVHRFVQFRSRTRLEPIGDVIEQSDDTMNFAREKNLTMSVKFINKDK